VLAGYDNLAG
jgi:hypothetical protein